MSTKSTLHKTADVRQTGWWIVVPFLVCAVVQYLFFSHFLTQYQRNNASDSASYLTEINRQGMETVKSLLSEDRNLAHTLAYNLQSASFTSDEQLLSFLSYIKGFWSIVDLLVYTENGICLNAEGEALNNGLASEHATDTLQNGEDFRIVKTQAEYSVAVNTKATFRGSPIVAVSVLHNLDHIIKDIGFRPFRENSAVYITKNNGVKICQSKNENNKSPYNVLSLFENGTLDNLSIVGQTDLKMIMQQGKDGVFLFTGKGISATYVVLTAINFMDDTLFLFTLVPQNIADKSMKAFSYQVFVLSVVNFLLLLGIFGLFLVVNRMKNRSYRVVLRSREHLFDLLVSQTQNGFMLLMDGKSEPSYMSSNLSSILGVDIQRLTKTQNGFMLEGKGQSLALDEVNKALTRWDGKQEFASGYLPCQKSGETRYLRLNIYPVKSKKEEYIGLFQDVTPEFIREQNLKDALHMASSANNAKTNFLSNMSHDIRTPLNAIINMTRFLQQDGLQDNKLSQERIGIIQESSIHLLGLVNDVLDMSRIESGKFSFNNAPFDLNETIEAVHTIINPLCDNKKQIFRLQKNNLSHTQLFGDKLRLNQILINILNNANKYTQEGGTISLEVSELPSIKKGSVPLRFSVADNGMGISGENLKTIFDPFSRVENNLVKSTEGSGLGLAITKSFVDALGGTITVESQVGKGSLFTIELFYEEAQSKTEKTIPAEDISTVRFDGKRALIVEDNIINLSIASTILKAWGMLTESATNGQIACELFEAKPAGYYHIIFMDIQMPVMNGYDASRHIRSSAKSDAKSVPIIAMTANAFAEDVEKARTSGMNAHVAKPIDTEQLRLVIRSFL